jgi:hypothetical protein
VVVRALQGRGCVHQPGPSAGWLSPSRSRGGIGRLRLAGRSQTAKGTHVSAELGGVRLDFTEAEFDDVIDLHAYSGWGSVTIIVPRGVAVRITHQKAVLTNCWTRRTAGSTDKSCGAANNPKMVMNYQPT